MKAREEYPINSITAQNTISRRTFMHLSAGLPGATAISGLEYLANAALKNWKKP